MQLPRRAPLPRGGSLLASLALACAFAVAGAALGPTQPQAASIAALVNNDAISTYDVQQRTRLMQVTGQSGGQQGALDDLIEERLKIQEARRLNISVEQEEIDQAFGSIAQRVQLSPAELTQALGQSGVNAETLKNRLRSDLAWRKVVQARVQSSPGIREQDVIAALRTRGEAGADTVVEYDLQQIVFVVPDGAGQAVARQKQSEANNVRARFRSCQETLPTLQGMRDVIVRRIGTRRSVDLDQELRETLAATQVNALTPPNPTRTGIEMVAVCGRQSVRDDRAGREELRQELLSQEMEGDAERLMQELKQTAIIERR